MPYPVGLPIHTIWDEIAYLLDAPKDLLSLALSCHTFKELIIPDHLEYRHIRCDIRRNSLWTFLASRPRLARGIRFVQLVGEGGSSIVRLPKACSFLSKPNAPMPSTDENTQLFRNALSHMISLKKFHWEQSYTSPQNLIDIFHVLSNKTRCLEALFMYLNWLRGGTDDELQLNKPSVWALTGLIKLILFEPGLAAIQMLHLSPDIEDLSLWGIPGTSAAYMMQYINMKKLRRLCLIADPLHPIIDISVMVLFFDRHLNIECLTLDLNDTPIPELPPSCLPKLRSIGGKLNNAFTSTPSLPVDVISHLVHFNCPIIDLDIDALPQMNNLITCYPGSFHYHGRIPAYLSLFLMKAPNLKKLCLDIDLGVEIIGFDRHSQEEIDAQERVVEALFKCPSLTHAFCDFELHGADHNNPGKSLEPLSKKLSALRSLKYLRIILGKEKKFVEIERGEDELYSGYRFITIDEVGEELEDPNSWGNLFSLEI